MAFGPKEVLVDRSQEFANLLERLIDIELARLTSREKSRLRRYGEIKLSIGRSEVRDAGFGDEANDFFIVKKVQELVCSKYVNSTVGWYSMSFEYSSKSDNYYSVTLAIKTQNKKVEQ
jgi:hypothetical protein